MRGLLLPGWRGLPDRLPGSHLGGDYRGVVRLGLEIFTFYLYIYTLHRKLICGIPRKFSSGVPVGEPRFHRHFSRMTPIEGAEVFFRGPRGFGNWFPGCSGGRELASGFGRGKEVLLLRES